MEKKRRINKVTLTLIRNQEKATRQLVAARNALVKTIMKAEMIDGVDGTISSTGADVTIAPKALPRICQ